MRNTRLAVILIWMLTVGMVDGYLASAIPTSDGGCHVHDQRVVAR